MRAAQAEKEFESLGAILVDSLTTREFDFDELRDHAHFDEPRPAQGEYECPPPGPDLSASPR